MGKRLSHASFYKIEPIFFINVFSFILEESKTMMAFTFTDPHRKVGMCVDRFFLHFLFRYNITIDAATNKPP